MGCTPQKSRPPLNPPYRPQWDGAPSPLIRAPSGHGATSVHLKSARGCQIHTGPRNFSITAQVPAGLQGSRAQYHTLPQARASKVVSCSEGDAKGGPPAGRATGAAQARPCPQLPTEALLWPIPPTHTGRRLFTSRTQWAWATAPTSLSAGRYLLPGGLLRRDLSRAREPGEGDSEATPRRTGQGSQNYRGSPRLEAGTWRGRLGSPSMTCGRHEASVVLGSGSLEMDIAHLQTNLIQKQHLQRLCI